MDGPWRGDDRLLILHPDMACFSGIAHKMADAVLAALTGQARPRLCYLPTAAADRPSAIDSWYAYCEVLDVEPFHQEVFISSYRMERGWDEVLLSMDGIVASGGNTLNQQAIWRAQGWSVWPKYSSIETCPVLAERSGSRTSGAGSSRVNSSKYC